MFRVGTRAPTVSSTEVHNLVPLKAFSNNSIQFCIYLSADLNSIRPIIIQFSSIQDKKKRIKLPLWLSSMQCARITELRSRVIFPFHILMVPVSNLWPGTSIPNIFFRDFSHSLQGSTWMMSLMGNGLFLSPFIQFVIHSFPTSWQYGE